VPWEFDITEAIEEAYERCGVDAKAGYKLKSALFSANLLLAEWSNENLLQWTISEREYAIVENSDSYRLGVDVVDVFDVHIRDENGRDFPLNKALLRDYLDRRNSTVGIDPFPETAIPDNAPDPFDYSTDTFDLRFISGNGRIRLRWSDVPNAVSYNIYYATKSFNQISAAQFQTHAENNGGGVKVSQETTLVIDGIKNDTEYFVIVTATDNSNPAQTSKPSKEVSVTPGVVDSERPNFWVLDKQIPNQLLRIYPRSFNTDHKLIVQCVLTLNGSDGLANYDNELDMPIGFYSAFVDGLAYKLAIKNKPELAQMFGQIYMQSLSKAKAKNSGNNAFFTGFVR